ncbi:MAG: PilZ domain-containing protein [Acidobacteriota bacterium]
MSKSMTPQKRRVLAIGLSAEEFAHIEPCLDHADFEVDRFPSARGALELIAPLPIEVLLVRYPLRGMDLEDFLDAVRRPATMSRHSSLVLLARASRRAEAEQFIGRGANRVVCLETALGHLQGHVAELVRVAPRLRISFPVRLGEDGGDGGWDCRVCDTSASGALIETQRKPEPGTRISFQLAPPQGPRVTGSGEVVRHTRPDRGEVDGMGVRFLRFDPGCRAAFRDFLAAQAD